MFYYVQGQCNPDNYDHFYSISCWNQLRGGIRQRGSECQLHRWQGHRRRCLQIGSQRSLPSIPESDPHTHHWQPWASFPTSPTRTDPSQDVEKPRRPSPQAGRLQKNPEGTKLCKQILPEGPVRSSKEKEMRLEGGRAQHTVHVRAYGSTRSRGPLRVSYTFWEVLASTKPGQEVRTTNNFKKSKWSAIIRRWYLYEIWANQWKDIRIYKND